MKSFALKLIAILLAAVFLLLGIASALGMILMADWEMNEHTPEELWNQELRHKALLVAHTKAGAYQTYEYSTVPDEVLQYAVDRGIAAVSTPNLGDGVRVIGWIITDQAGHTESEGSMAPADNRQHFRFEAIEASFDLVVPTSSLPSGAGSGAITAFNYNDTSYAAIRTPGEPVTVEVTLEIADIPGEWNVLFFLYAIRKMLPLILVGSLLLFGAAMVYLCWVAGKKDHTAEVLPGGLNRLPLDVYGAAVGLAGVGGVYLLFYLIEVQEHNGFTWMLTWLMVLLALAVCLLPVVYIFAIAAQIKAKNHFWWRRSLVGFVLISVYRAIRWCWRGLQAVARLLPVVWQWLLTAAGMTLALCFTGFVAFILNSFIRPVPFFVLLFLAVMLGCVGIILYGGYCFGTIMKAAKEMAGGNLDYKVNTKNLLAAFRDCGESLNSLSDAAMAAAQQQMKSERMKTELIANVSHDIKTPLTSIINYVDLLQKPHSEEENAQYLDVLSRQSQRLKKLTEDLVEMSKATTGNIAAELTQVDACEAVRQALGEFSDKLEAAGLTVVLRQPEVPVMMRSDGRLTWRVLSNLLSNAVKYAQSDTRLYVDVAAHQNSVQISLKNVSREQLNITADELMERFVRGDAARHTEGSGLGLSIAKGLMEAQNGTLQLLTDGDLFKVTLEFPKAHDI